MVATPDKKVCVIFFHLCLEKKLIIYIEVHLNVVYTFANLYIEEHIFLWYTTGSFNVPQAHLRFRTLKW